MARYFRIAAAVFFAIMALAFVALWARSYQHHDVVRAPGLFVNLGVGSNRGAIVLGVVSLALTDPWHWRVLEYPLALTPNGWADKTIAGFGVDEQFDGGMVYLYLPHWFLAASSLAIAALFAFKKSWRFTVRGLLIGTTVVAAALGLAVWVV